jgi:hypothetical protein
MKQKWAGVVARLVEYLLSKYEVLHSNLSTTKQNKAKKQVYHQIEELCYFLPAWINGVICWSFKLWWCPSCVCVIF